MTRETHRDQVWKYIVEHRDLNTEFSKRDIIDSVEASAQTVRDVVQTATDYGLLDTREERIYFSYLPDTSSEDMIDPEFVYYDPVIPGDETWSSSFEESPAVPAEYSAGFTDWIRAMDIPQGKDTVNCAQVVSKCCDFLDEWGPASGNAIISVVMPDHSLGYDVPDLDVGDQYRGAWWRRIVQPGLKAHPEVECRDNHQDYRIQPGDD